MAPFTAYFPTNFMTLEIKIKSKCKPPRRKKKVVQLSTRQVSKQNPYSKLKIFACLNLTLRLLNLTSIDDECFVMEFMIKLISLRLKH